MIDGEATIEYLNGRVAELEQERDQLAAHVERLRKAALDAIHFIPGGQVKASLRDAYDETPTTSLARRDLIKQAEALEEVCQKHSRDMIHPRIIQCLAEDLRQQAEALT